MTQLITTYLKHIEQNLATRDATEYTHWPALAYFLETLGDDVHAIHEPRLERRLPAKESENINERN